MSIKLLVMDVDGTLTDGCIYVGNDGEQIKAFNVHDGYAIAHILPLHNIIPIIITGRRSKIVERRATELGIVHLYQGITSKYEILQTIVSDLDMNICDVAYIGDDLNDLDCILHCGLTACPADAVPQVRSSVDLVCSHNGGCGAVREFIDYIIGNTTE